MPKIFRSMPRISPWIKAHFEAQSWPMTIVRIHKAGKIHSLFCRPDITLVAFISILADKPPYA
jgi:hypothetical protein